MSVPLDLPLGRVTKTSRMVEKRTGYISTADMNALHSKCNLKLLYERRRIFMLKLMYKLSQDEENINNFRPERVL